MSSEQLRKLGPGKSGARRQVVHVSQSELVHTSPLLDGDLPLLVQPAGPEIRLELWARGNRETIHGWLRKHGGILFRGFDIAHAKAFQEVTRAISGELLGYEERSSPRHAVVGWDTNRLAMA